MSNNKRLLVVDDEPVICQACRRVFSRQGFQVEESSDPSEGLNWATERDYAAILLDIKMPGMDGIDFLEALRHKKPEVPVMIMTGYPSVPNASAALRLGASDYVTKPFTPEEITQSVQRMLAGHGGADDQEESACEEADEEAGPRQQDGFLFLDEAWFQLESDGSACVGAVLPPQEAKVQSVRLPRIGEVVYQGLPLAGLMLEGEPPLIIPAPVSGVVVGINEELGDDPALLLGDPCGKGWIACICTTRLQEELDRCKSRQVILANADEVSADRQREQLTRLGCQVQVVRHWEQLAPAIRDPDCDVLVFDATSFDGVGLELVRRVNVEAPAVKVVVVASSSCKWETPYRQHKIFYYAVEPFADKEIVEILNAAFRSGAWSAAAAECRKHPSEPVHGICITNRNRHRVHLLAEPGLLHRDDGLGGQIRRKLDARMFPIVTTPGDAAITSADIVKTADCCDRLMVLVTKETGRLPGSLARDTRPDWIPLSEENAGKVTALAVQPYTNGRNLAEFDSRTTEALAEHIVQEMASY